MTTRIRLLSVLMLITAVIAVGVIILKVDGPGGGAGAPAAGRSVGGSTSNVAVEAQPNVGPNTGQPGQGQQTADTTASIDQLFQGVDQKAPGFGGMFYDDQGRLNVYLLDPAAAAAAQAAVAAEFGGDRIPVQGVNVLAGQYAYSQLNDWNSRMLAVLAIDGVISTDIDESANRLRVGVEDLGVSGAVEERLTALEIPRAAVVIEQSEQVLEGASTPTPGNTIRHTVRPLVGGLEIGFQEAATGAQSTCTLGFIATLGNQTGFVTNYHCTGTGGVVYRTTFSQPNGGSTVGEEAKDPPFFSCAFSGAAPPNKSTPTITLKGTPTPNGGQRCRNSDSAFVHLKSGVKADLGYIAKPNGIGSLNIQKRYRIVDVKNQPVMGDNLAKVGRTSGLSQGPVIATCQNLKSGGVVKLCQDRAAFVGDFGDSGSPVFGITNFPQQNDVRLYGIFWGGPDDGKTSNFSNMGQVQKDLGPLTVLGSGVTPVKPTAPVPSKTPEQQQFAFVNNTSAKASGLTVQFNAPLTSAKVSAPNGCTLNRNEFVGDTYSIEWTKKCVADGSVTNTLWEGVVPATFEVDGNRLRILEYKATSGPYQFVNVKVRVDTCDGANGPFRNATRKAPPNDQYWDVPAYANKCIIFGTSRVTVVVDSLEPGGGDARVAVMNDDFEIGTFSLQRLARGVPEVVLGVTSNKKPLKVVSVTWTNQGTPLPTKAATNTPIQPTPTSTVQKGDQLFILQNNTTGRASDLRVQFNADLISANIFLPFGCRLVQPNGISFPANDTVQFVWTNKCVPKGEQVRIIVQSQTNPLTVMSVTWTNQQTPIPTQATVVPTLPPYQFFTFFNNTNGKARQLRVTFNAEVLQADVVRQPGVCSNPTPTRTATSTPRPKPNLKTPTPSGSPNIVNVLWPAACIQPKHLTPTPPTPEAVGGQLVELRVRSLKSPLKVVSVQWLDAAGAVLPPQPTAPPMPTKTPRVLGGVAAYPDLSSGSSAGLLAGASAGALAAVLLLGGAGWYVRRRFLS